MDNALEVIDTPMFVPTGSSKFGTALLRTKIRSHEHILEEIDEETISELGKLAKKGFTLPEMAHVLGISYVELVKTRQVSEEFDELCRVLETAAVSKHLKSARLGITNPKRFNSAAYDRVMGALNFTPHVENVQHHSASAEASEQTDSARVGFDVDNFMGKHGETVVVEGVLVDEDEGLTDEESIL